MAARIAAEIREIESKDLRSSDSWDDEAQGFASAAEAAAMMEAPAPIIAHLIDSEKTDPPKWTWSAGPASDETLYKWNAILCMTGATPYADGRFELTIDLPEDYAFKPPFFKFKTRVFHPGVGEDGKICLAELQLKENGGTWDPTKKIHHIMDLIGGMMAYPESILGHPLRPELGGLLKDDKARFIKTAKRETESYAV